MTTPKLFTSTLRQQRERRGLTLSAIAEHTKISRHLLLSLECGDMSRLPGGIYRRSLVRAYAAAVGLPPEPTLCEFVRLFPEPGQNPPVPGDDDPDRLRLTLVTEPRWQAPALRLAAAFIDIGLVLFVGYVVSMFAGIGFWTSACLVGITFHVTAAVIVGRSPGAWFMTPGSALQKPRAIRDELALLRQKWFPALDEPRESSASTTP